MTARRSILHITPHLGGGVGRVLAAVARRHREQGAPFRHIFACLEAAENSQFVDRIRADGFAVTAPVDHAALGEMASAADIVQLEWWHHPRLVGWLMGRPNLRSRLVMWAHTSGLHVPALPRQIVALPHAFLFTSPASLTGRKLPDGNLVDVVSSSGGFEDFPAVKRQASGRELRCGYLGSFNAAKLHPDFLDYTAAVERPDFAIDCYGDASVAPVLRRAAANSAGLVRLHGQTSRPAAVLGELDIFVYLLNPQHYGTTENALLEAMACGAVPVVMNNPVEQSIVAHGETGWVIDTPRRLHDTIDRMIRRPDERLRMSKAASRHVRETYGLDRTACALASCYTRVLAENKRCHDFANILGATPADWFMASLGQYDHLLKLGSSAAATQERRRHAFLYEPTKSSAFHFQRCFPGDPRLNRWVDTLAADLAGAAAAAA